MKTSEIAQKLDVAIKTIYNWKENRPKLYEVIEKGLGIKKSNVNITQDKETKEIKKLLEKLEKKEKIMYIHEIKARILKKEIDKN